MFLELESADDFRKCIDGIAALVTEAEFVVGKESMTLKATDPSNISMVDFELPAKAFRSYDVDEPVKLGVDLDYLNQVMKRSKSNDRLSLSLSEDRSSLVVEFKGKSERKFQIPLIDISGNEIPPLKIEFDAIISLNAEILQDGLKDAVLFSSHVILSANEKEFSIKANSSKGTLNSVTKKTDAAIKSLDLKEDAEAMYPLDYLQDMLKTASSDTAVEIKLKNDAPLFVSFKIGEATISYFLAPRMEPK